MRRDSCARWANLQYRFTPFRRESPLLCLTSSPLTCLQTKTLWEATQARKTKKSTKNQENKETTRPTTVPSGDKATAAEADPVATRIPLSDEEDWKFVSKVPPRKKQAVLYVGCFHKHQDESNLCQYISKRCLGLGNVTAVIDTCSIQTKEQHTNAHVSLNADAAQHLWRRGFWVHRIYARYWVFNNKPVAAIKNQQQGGGGGVTNSSSSSRSPGTRRG